MAVKILFIGVSKDSVSSAGLSKDLFGSVGVSKDFFLVQLVSVKFC